MALAPSSVAVALLWVMTSSWAQTQPAGLPLRSSPLLEEAVTDRSPLSKGVLLADEVGLGKTIEAGIVLCQYWAERKRQLFTLHGQ